MLTKSFYGSEDRGLLNRLSAELPGIVRWALGGLADLESVGRFTETDAGLEIQREMADLGNPLRVFLDERCVLDRAAFTFIQDLFEEFLVWADGTEHFKINRERFKRDFEDAVESGTLKYAKRHVGAKSAWGFWGVRIAS